MSTDLPGFADPVGEAQHCFRAVLDAMAHPGRVVPLRTTLRPPAALHPATAAALLTLIDAETPVWLEETLCAAQGWLGFHCGVPFVPLDQARFIVAESLPALDLLHAGSDEAPEEGATVILQLASLNSGREYTLAGPGLQRPGTLRCQDLPVGFEAIWQGNHDRFPRGIDLVLCAGDCLAALPRSVQLKEA